MINIAAQNASLKTELKDLCSIKSTLEMEKKALELEKMDNAVRFISSGYLRDIVLPELLVLGHSNNQKSINLGKSPVFSSMNEFVVISNSHMNLQYSFIKFVFLGV